MNENLPQAPQGEFVLFQSADGRTRVEYRLKPILCGYHKQQWLNFIRLVHKRLLSI